MKSSHSVTGNLFITGAVLLLIPYSVLTMLFEYPDILRQDTAIVLTKFNQGGSMLIWTWFAFALAGIPLIPAYTMLGQMLEQRSSLARVATTAGITGLIVQMIGLLRWTFVVPVLSGTFMQSSDPAIKAAAIISFRTMHQFAGVLMGEHLGQLFTIGWTVLISFIMTRHRLIPSWIAWFGYITSFVYLMAQAELIATVIPGFPNGEPAGFLGSTLWLIWMVMLGIRLRKLPLV